MGKALAIPPGNWVGVLGGGQLGRMFVHAAQRLGYHIAIFEPESGSPAAQSADRHFMPESNRDSELAMVDAMASLCQVITLEFENISSDLVRRAAEQTLTRPNADFLEMCQDRLREKGSLSEAGFPTTPFRAVTSEADVLIAAEDLGWPLVLKTARSGYDGKGQGIVTDADHLTTCWSSFGDLHLIAEKWIEFESEVSMIAARNPRGDIECYPLIENEHANHILDVSRCPVRPELQKYDAIARDICRGIAERFDVVGLFCIEFFVTKQGELIVNEVAPRPHNSGHLTIEAFTCSQFEQQLRAVCDLPLVKPVQIQPAAMANLLGDVWFIAEQLTEPQWSVILDQPQAHLHLYGKREPWRRRKMGHITVLGEDAAPRTVKMRNQLRNELK